MTIHPVYKEERMKDYMYSVKFPYEVLSQSYYTLFKKSVSKIQSQTI